MTLVSVSASFPSLVSRIKTQQQQTEWIPFILIIIYVVICFDIITESSLK